METQRGSYMIDYSEILKRFKEKGINGYSVLQHKIMGQTTYGKLSKGDGNISVSTIEDICQLLQCQPLELLQNWSVDLDPEKSWEMRTNKEMTYFERMEQIEQLKKLDYSTIPAVNFQPINVYGENHQFAAEWLKKQLVNKSKSQEILIRMDCEKKFNVIVSSE